MLLQRMGGPDTELGPPFGINAITHRKNCVEVVVFHYAPYLASALLLNCCIFCNSCLAAQLTGFVDARQMPRDNRFVAPEKLGDLIERQPNRFPFQHDLDGRLTAQSTI